MSRFPSLAFVYAYCLRMQLLIPVLIPLLRVVPLHRSRCRPQPHNVSTYSFVLPSSTITHFPLASHVKDPCHSSPFPSLVLAPILTRGLPGTTFQNLSTVHKIPSTELQHRASNQHQTKNGGMGFRIPTRREGNGGTGNNGTFSLLEARCLQRVRSAARNTNT